MKVGIFDPAPYSNEYLTRMYLGPLRSYMRDKKVEFNELSSLEEAKDIIVIVHGDLLCPESILALKNNGCSISVMDINDSSYLSSRYVNTPEQHLVDLIFKVSGVPKQNEINETNLDRNFRIQLSREKYLPDAQWCEFLKLRPRIRPLPYVLWNPLVAPNTQTVPQTQRSGKALIRGGNHFWRVILFFRLMQEGLLDSNSEFLTADYFKPEMERRFQYCDGCKAEKAQHGKSVYDAPVRRTECTNPVTGWEVPGEFFGGPLFGRHEFGWWNNKCPHSFFFLAKEYERLRGPLDHPFIERAFNGQLRPNDTFIHDLSHASVAADMKWLNTINLPPRFWEAASVGTPSFYTDRTKDQEYWPAVQEGVHYLTYKEDMESLRTDMVEPPFTDVGAAVKDLYETKIRGTQYPISNALLEYMMNSIEEIV